MTTKSVEFSYPTSTNARKAGRHKEGCFTVSKSVDHKPPFAVAHFATRKEAEEFALTLEEPFAWWYLKWNPHMDKTQNAS